MPKILRIINRFNLGGPTYNASYLTKYMPPEFETMLIGGEKDETEESSLHIPRSLGIEPIILDEMKRPINPIQDLKAYQKIKSKIQEYKPDIVHTHASKSGFIGRLAAYNLKVPVIVHTFHGHVFHSYFNSALTNFYKILERYAASKSDAIIAISEKQKYELAHIHHICKPDKIKVIPLGFELEKFSENMEEKRKSFRDFYNIDDDEVVIAIIGRLVPIKNHSLFLEALKEVKEKTTQKIRAFIVGDGEERQRIEQKASELGIDFIDALKSKEKATLTFTSWIKNVDWVNAGADIIALTSLNEGTPVSLIEAQAASKPIVSTSVGGIENIVIEGETALLSDKNDTAHFARNLLSLVESKELRKKMSEKGKNFVFEHFHYKRLVNDMAQFYHQLLAQKLK
jgi:glycosyltransferase involved in cell wall biosynthesis